MQNKENLKCIYCEKSIPQQNIILHEARCENEFVKSHNQQKQNQNIQIQQPTQQNELQHRFIMQPQSTEEDYCMCPSCGQKVYFSNLDEHYQSCLHQCQYCHNSFPQYTLHQHQQQCTARQQQQRGLRFQQQQSQRNNNYIQQSNQQQNSNQMFQNIQFPNNQQQQQIFGLRQQNQYGNRQNSFQQSIQDNGTTRTIVRQDQNGQEIIIVDSSGRRDRNAFNRRNPQNFNEIPSPRFQWLQEDFNQDINQEFGRQLINQMRRQSNNNNMMFLLNNFNNRDQCNNGGLKNSDIQSFKISKFKKLQQQKESAQNDGDQNHENKDIDKSQISCTICLCDYEDEDETKFLDCFHRFHSVCVDAWLKKNSLCPICRLDQKIDNQNNNNNNNYNNNH